MIILGTPNTTTATKLLLLGCGELGKEVAIEAQRLGLEVVAVDRYDHAPAMQVAHRRHVVPMLDARALTRVIQREQPDFIVPEIEAIATDALLELEQQGYQVVPTAKAAQLTMNREGIRRLADVACQVNERTENIGARRLHTIMERLLEELSFEAADKAGTEVSIDAEYVDSHLGALVQDEDLSRYIL